jgi:hypothetical protein
MQLGQLKRREFISLLGGSAAWPLAARAQSERVRRLGALMWQAEDDPDQDRGIRVLTRSCQSTTNFAVVHNGPQ